MALGVCVAWVVCVKGAGSSRLPLSRAQIHPSIVRMVKLAVTMLFIAHINGCLWFGISGGLDDDTWPNNVCDPNQCISEMGRGDQYMASVYWAFTTYVHGFAGRLCACPAVS